MPMFKPITHKRITVIASDKAIKKAERELIRLEFESKSNFAKSQLLARGAVKKFFNRELIQVDTFKRICTGLQLQWIETLDPNITIKLLQQNRVVDSETIESLIKQFESEDLTNSEDFSIEAVHPSLEEWLEEPENPNYRKWEVIQETVNNSKNYHDLHEADLVDADLSGAYFGWANLVRADLNGADLSGSYLRRADLSEADLSEADLSETNLSEANISRANLDGTNLSGADLSGVTLGRIDLSRASVQKTRLGEGLGLSDKEKQVLTERGAIFDSNPIACQ
jgi:uncharacterized protein YjbI with pentapeptide repeats